MTEFTLLAHAETRALFTALAWVAFGCLLAFLIHLRRVRELHHGYYGFLLVLTGHAVADAGWIRTASVLIVVGALLVAEDAGQHGEQAFRRGPWRQLTGADDTWPVHRATYWLLGKLGLHG